MTRNNEIKELVKQQKRDMRTIIEPTHFVGGAVPRPIKVVLDGMTTDQKMIFLAYVSDEIFTVREVKERLKTHHRTMQKKFLDLWITRKEMFPPARIRKIESKAKSRYPIIPVVF